MNQIQKTIRANCRRLKESGRTLEDIYRISFSRPDGVMTEDAALVGPSKYRTYGQIQREAETVARGITALTERTGQYVGLYGENDPRWFALFWGILKSGNKPYLINLRQPAEFSADALRTLGATVTLCLTSAPDLGTDCFSYDTVCQSAPETTPSVPFGDGFALSTSGTTLGRKICCFNGETISAQLLNMESMIKENPDLIRPYRGQVKHLMFLPLYHIFGLEAVFLWFSFFHSTFVFPPDLSPDHLLRTVRYHDVTHIFAVPLLWEAVERSVRKEAAKDEKTQAALEKGLSLSLKLQKIAPRWGRKLAARLFRDVRKRLFGDTVQFCISGGSSIKPETLSLLNGMGYSLCNGYGMSEIGITSVDLSLRAEDRIKGAIGRPVDSVEYRIDENGHLLVKGASVCPTMILDGIPTKTPQWFDTGDLMDRDERGRYHIRGRASDLVFGADGENLNPDLAEQAFSLPGAKNFSVLGNDTNEGLRLVIQIPQEITEPQKEQLFRAVEAGNETLPPAYQVREIRFTFDPIVGPQDIKVSRARLRNAIADGSVVLLERPNSPEEAATPPASPLKEQLRELFAEILGIAVDDVTDRGHFMNDLGGSSLDYFTLIGRIDEIFGVTLEFEMERYHYCLEDLERILKERMGA